MWLQQRSHKLHFKNHLCIFLSDISELRTKPLPSTRLVGAQKVLPWRSRSFPGTEPKCLRMQELRPVQRRQDSLGTTCRSLRCRTLPPTSSWPGMQWPPRSTRRGPRILGSWITALTASSHPLCRRRATLLFGFVAACRSLRRTLAWREGISRPIAAPGAWCLPRIELRRRVTGPRLRLRFAEPLRTPCRLTGRRTLRPCRHSSLTRSRVSGIFKHGSRRRVFRLNAAEKTGRSSIIAQWTELQHPGFSTSLHSFDFSRIFREIKQRFGSISRKFG